jgi:predicted pyridoxine 5'-phosphate oxidase superfamily flavin-nucleotide-binding protein
MAAGFHEGELLVQRRAGVHEEASRLAGMLAPPTFHAGASRFLAERDLVMITARDGAGDLWVSALHGRPGFCVAQGSTLVVSAVPGDGDPLHGLAPGQQVGVLAIDFGRRRRMRVNGTLARVGANELEIVADQAYGNCPRYIRQRHLGRDRLVDEPTVRRYDHLEPDHVAWIRQADTVILGTSHPTHGADASHRGGAPGFVRVEDGTLWWPDQPGNNLFNSLGNIVADPAAALLFLDVAAGRTLQISGTAVLDWVRPGSPGDDGGTGRRVRLTPLRVAETSGVPVRLPDPATFPDGVPS